LVKAFRFIRNRDFAIVLPSNQIDYICGTLVSQNSYAQSVEFVCKLTDDCWILTNIYAPCTTEGKSAFLQWFKDLT
jgi:hypothetical protein